MVSPQFDKVRRILRERRAASSPSTDIIELRRRMTEAVLPAGEDVTAEAIRVGGVLAERVAAGTAQADRVVLYAHGGGFCLGSPVTHRKLAGDISRASGAVCVVVDYRLAPEHPFPAPIEDLVAVYGALLESHPAESVLFAGDSAGGALVVLTASRLRDAGLPVPAGLVGLTPWTDYLCAGPSFVERADGDPITSVPELANYHNWFLGEHSPTDPRISPVHADLRGLPPMLLHGGDGDVMCDDAAVLAAHARAAGVDVTHRQVPEMLHVWHVFAGRVPEATEAVEEIGAFARRRFRQH